jgi:DNA repair exonuclease SbcCD ATPase subunit
MPRYFIKRVRIEGFRGINNEGEPLELLLKTDRVNSIFGANALGKSSTFEALSYAINGTVPKLDRLPAADEPASYYANRFHGSGTSTVSILFQPDDASGDVEITVSRAPNGTRSVSSSTGLADPEKFLRALDTELALLDHELFLEFVNDTPLRRGRAFSGLLGLAPLSEFRQTLEVLSNRKNVNADFEIDTLEQEIGRVRQDEKGAESSLRTAFRGFFSQELPSVPNLEEIATSVASALSQIPLVLLCYKIRHISCKN